MADRTLLLAGATAVVYAVVVALAAWMTLVLVACNVYLPFGPHPAGLPCANVWWPHPAVPWLAAALTALAAAGFVAAGAGAVRRQVWGTRAQVRELLAARTPASDELAEVAAQVGVVEVVQVDYEEVFAFCHGLRSPQVVVSSGLVDLLGEQELRAVLAHEARHAASRDPLRVAVLRTIASVTAFFPVLGDLAVREAARREVAADRWAVSQVGRRPLLEALTAVLACPRMSLTIDVPGFDSLDVRVNALVDDPTGAARPYGRVPRSRLAVTAVAATLLLTLGGVVGWASLHVASAPVHTAEVAPTGADPLTGSRDEHPDG